MKKWKSTKKLKYHKNGKLQKKEILENIFRKPKISKLYSF